MPKVTKACLWNRPLPIWPKNSEPTLVSVIIIIIIIVVVSVSDVSREKNTIHFSYYTNSNMEALCRLLSMNGVPMKSIKFPAEKRQRGVFKDVNPKRSYKLQCQIGESITENSGIFRSSSETITIPRDSHDVTRTVIRIVSVILFVVFGVCGLIILFRFPEFFDIFIPS